MGTFVCRRGTCCSLRQPASETYWKQLAWRSARHALPQWYPISTMTLPSVAGTVSSSQKTYCSTIGTLQVLACDSRAPIMMAVNVLAQYSASPSSWIIIFIKRLFSVLKLTKYFTLQIELQNRKPEILPFYANSNSCGDAGTGMARSKWIESYCRLKITSNYGKQSWAALSIAEPEHTSTSSVGSVIKFIKILFCSDLSDTRQSSLAVLKNQRQCIMAWMLRQYVLRKTYLPHT